MSKKPIPHERLEYMKATMVEHLREAGYSDEVIQKAKLRLKEIEAQQANDLPAPEPGEERGV